LVDTAGDASSLIPPATRTAFYGEDMLGPNGVTYSSLGPAATLTATLGLFAERTWDCACATLTDLGKQTLTVDDRTVAFPLGKKAIDENKRLLRKALKQCARKPRPKQVACRAKARERFRGERRDWSQDYVQRPRTLRSRPCCVRSH
jgi:hypothetical protein